MKRVIVISTKVVEEKKYYTFSENGSELFAVDYLTKKVSGKDLFIRIYESYTKDNPFTIECNIDALSSEEKKLFGNYLVTLFQKIDAKMKEQFNEDDSQSSTQS